MLLQRLPSARMHLRLAYLALTLVLLVRAPTAETAERTDAPLLRLVHISDLHFPVGRGAERLQQCFQEVARLSPPPAFIILTGDVTEFGENEALEGYAAVAAQSPIPILAVPGNHDVRWSPVTDTRRREALLSALPLDAARAPVGIAAAFIRGGVRVLLLDSSIPLHQHGTIDPAQRAWLVTWLQSHPAAATVVFLHHPPFDPTGTPLPGGFELLALLGGPRAPPIAIFTGHGHANRRWTVTGVPIVMTGALYSETGGYRVVDVYRGRILVRLRRWDTPAVIEAVQLFPPLHSRSPLSRGETVATRTVQHDERFLDLRADATRWLPLPARMITLPRGLRGVTVRARFGDHAFDPTALDFDWGAVQVIRLPSDAPLASRVRYRFTVGGSVLGAPASDGSLLFAGDTTGTVTAFDVERGQKVWTTRLSGRIVGGVTAAAGSLYVGAGDTLYALRAADGSGIWQRRFAGPIRGRPVVDEDRLSIVAGTTLYALRLADGEVRWSHAMGGLIQSGPTRVGDLLIVGAWDNLVRALNRCTGETVWTRPGATSRYYSPGAGTPPLALGSLVLLTASLGRDTPGVWALDTATGAVQWTARYSAGYCRLASDSDRVLLATLSGEVVALRSDDGTPVWATQLGEPVVGASVAVADGVVYTVTLHGTVWALESGDGAPRWHTAVGDGFWLSPIVVVDDTLVVASTEGVLCVLERGATR